jgi:hypothetical protein
VIAPSVADHARAWTGTFHIHGLAIGLRSSVPAVTDVVARSYAAFAVPAPSGASTADPDTWIDVRADRGGYRLSVDRGWSILARDETAATLGTLDRIVIAVLGGLAERGVLGTHAGVVAIDGRAVLLAGPSGRGKSTLTLALLRARAALLTDELALVAADGRTVLPYPRALHVSLNTVALVPGLDFLQGRPRQALGGESEWSVSATDIAAAFGASVAGPTPLGLIVLLGERLDAGASPRIEPVPAAVAVMELLRGTPAAATDFPTTMRRLGTIAEAVPTVRLWAADPVQTAAELRDYVAGLP